MLVCGLGNVADHWSTLDISNIAWVIFLFWRAGKCGTGDFVLGMVLSFACRRWSSVVSWGMGMLCTKKMSVSQLISARVDGI